MLPLDNMTSLRKLSVNILHLLNGLCRRGQLLLRVGLNQIAELNVGLWWDPINDGAEVGFLHHGLLFANELALAGWECFVRGVTHHWILKPIHLLIIE